ncbi:MAG: RloB domain-containing protein [Pseudomonas sp.]|nr:RloB domain-containing protein [Pseudomonas sp.]
MARGRSIPAAPSVKGVTPKIDPKVEIYIVCEGQNTEPQYFTSCAQAYGSGLVIIRPIPAAGAPMTLVSKAAELKATLLAERRRSKDSYDCCFRVWAVFDRDEHPRVDEALQMARDHKVDVAFSNPCFELWPVLHIESYGSQSDRHALQKYLSGLMPNYDHQYGAIVDFDQIKDQVDSAISRAEALLVQRELEGVPLGAPSTTVCALVKKIIENGKRWTPRS